MRGGEVGLADLTADVKLSLRLQDWQWEVEGARTGFYWGWREGGNAVGTPLATPTTEPPHPPTPKLGGVAGLKECARFNTSAKSSWLCRHEKKK